jgi:hypothetical protein
VLKIPDSNLAHTSDELDPVSIPLFNLIGSGLSSEASRENTPKSMSNLEPSKIFNLKDVLNIVDRTEQTPRSAGRIKGMSPKVYSVNVTQDISCIERLDTIVNTIKDNHNRICPFCKGCTKITAMNLLNVF